MSFSEYGRYIRGNYSVLSAQDRPCDAGIARNVVNNCQHIYDESGQVLINMAGRNGGKAVYQVTNAAMQPLLVLGPFPIRLRPNSGAFRLRMYAELGRSGAVAAEFRAVVGTSYADVLSRGATNAPSASVWNATVNTAQAAFTPSGNMIQLVDDVIGDSYQPVSAMDDGNNVVSALWPQCHIAIFGRSTGTTQNLEIFSLYACEFMGQ